MKKVVNLVFITASCYYMWLFWQSLGGRWFDPRWTTDDAVQQTYPFWKVIDAELFQDDLITKVMEGYLAPLHYWLNVVITYFTHSPIMTGHVVMFIQVTLSLLFLFLTVHKICNAWPPALFACIWLLHTRTVVMRMTGGLPRGWAVPLLTGFIYLVMQDRHRSVLLLIGIGCVLNPPTTFLIAFSYGVWLLYLTIIRKSSSGFIALKQLLIVSPVFLLTVWLVVQKPPEIGAMVNYEQAKVMPAFNPGGRFPFLPLPTITNHILKFGFNPFFNRLHTPVPFIQDWGWLCVITVLLIFLFIGLRKQYETVPMQLWIFLVGIITVYLASRQLLFYLYVPDRHLLAPLSVFFIVVFSSAMWIVFSRARRGVNYIKGALGLLALAIFIYFGSGLGLTGDANFNYYYLRQGRAFEWLANNTKKQAVIAGHPTHVNPVTLFAKRKVYVSAEVAHPFYPVFYKEMERRLDKSIRAHYARTLPEFMEILSGEAIDYFVFSRQRFYAHNLKTESFYEPFTELIKELVNREHTDYAYKQLPKNVDLKVNPYLVFRDDHSAIVDLHKLRETLQDKNAS